MSQRALPYDPQFTLRALPQHLRVSTKYYEDIDSYQHDDTFTSVVTSALGTFWRTVRSGVWIQANPPRSALPIQGWKIHVSACSQDASWVLREVASVCVKHTTPFKFIADDELLILTNSKSWPRGSSGKFITIYPKDNDQFLGILENLHEALVDANGPYVLSDRRYRDSKVLYYRFGGFKRIETMNVDGHVDLNVVSPSGHLERDDRSPIYSPPSWAPSPVSTVESDEANGAILGDGRYDIFEVLRFTNSGGVYKARDLTTNRTVIIKEARPFAGVTTGCEDAVSMRRREWRVLLKLERTGVVPRVIDFFTDWEHTFLVEDYIEGTTLWEWVAENNNFIHENASHEMRSAYNANTIQIARLLCTALKEVHGQEVAIGDISYSNVLISEDVSSVTLIDLETAIEVGKDEPGSMFTPGFVSAFDSNLPHDSYAQDHYGLGMLFMTMVLPIQSLTFLKPDAVPLFLDDLHKERGVDDRLCSAINYLIGSASNEQVQLDTVIRLLDAKSPRLANSEDASQASRH